MQAVPDHDDRHTPRSGADEPAPERTDTGRRPPAGDLPDEQPSSTSEPAYDDPRGQRQPEDGDEGGGNEGGS
jgi:hypothetical protein